VLFSYPPKQILSDMHKAVKSLKLCFLQYPFNKDTFEPPKHAPPVKQGKHSNGSNF
jgi:hypothetical protein